MKYLEPTITNVFKADATIQGQDKIGPASEDVLLTAPPAYEADE